jgi:hypothetical protein
MNMNVISAGSDSADDAISATPIQQNVLTAIKGFTTFSQRQPLSTKDPVFT